MSNKKLQIFPSDLMMETIDRLPKGTKAKFINLCVEYCISDNDIKSKLLLKLLGFGDQAVTITEPTTELAAASSDDTPTTNEKIITSKMISFK